MSTKELLELAGRTCIPCKGETPAFGSADIDAYQEKLDSGWEVIDNHHLEKVFKFEGYEAAVDFANLVANIAIEQDHHPEILLAYGKVTVVVWTHKAGGLTENDFVFAAKVEETHRG
jgi:4a-hydroxytetrahydrobiopterin dehydratase